eukprot:1190226-Prorocentrum_minimum.AAC.4
MPPPVTQLIRLPDPAGQRRFGERSAGRPWASRGRARVLDPRELFKQAAEVQQRPPVGLDTHIDPLNLKHAFHASPLPLAWSPSRP